jgi:hypothetical protein
MNKREVAALAVRLLGIYCMLQGLLFVPLVIWHFRTGDMLGPQGPFAWLSYLVPTVLFPLVGLILLLRADRFARRMVGDTAEPSPTGPWTSRDVLAVALAVVGAYLAAMALPQLAGQIVTVVESISGIATRSGRSPREMQILEVTSLLQIALRLALGIYIFVAAPRLSDLWHRVRQLPPAKGERA